MTGISRPGLDGAEPFSLGSADLIGMFRLESSKRHAWRFPASGSGFKELSTASGVSRPWMSEAGSDATMIEQTLKGRTVLLAEDNPLEAIEYCDWLCDAGAEVMGPVASVRQALSLLMSGRVDAAVVDYALADDNSGRLQIALEELHIPFVVVTGYPRPLVRRSKSQKILPKPLDSDVLCISVQELLGTNPG